MDFIDSIPEPKPRPRMRVAYHNRQWGDSDDVQIAAGDAAVTQAVTAVERLRAYQGVLFQLARHLDRWERTTAALSIDDLPSRSQLSELLDELIRRNQTWIALQDSFGVVMFASPGVQGQSTLVIDLYPINASLIAQRVNHGTPVVVTAIEQPSGASWSRNIKVRCRLHYYLADREAQSVDSHAIGILVDSDGTVTETSIANIVLVEQGILVSPPNDQVLCGVSLQVVRDLAANLGIEWREERITPHRLRGANEVLLTGTSCGLWFAQSIDGSAVQSAGPIYRKLRAAFDDFITFPKSLT